MDSSQDAGHDLERGSKEPKADGDSDESSFKVSFASDDPLNPRNAYSGPRKWIMVLVVSSVSTCVTCTSSLYTQTYDQIAPEFGCSEIVAILGLSLFVAGLGIGPMLLAPLSEVGIADSYHGIFRFALQYGETPHIDIRVPTSSSLWTALTGSATRAANV